MLNPTPDAELDSLFETTSQMDVQAPTTVASLTLSTPTLTRSTIATISATVNEQLEAEVLTRSSNSSKTSYAVVANLSEMELKKILIEKMEVTLKRRRDDDVDKDEEPSVASDGGSKRRREGKEPESTSAPNEKATRITGKFTQGSKSQQRTTNESALAEEPLQTTRDLEESSHQEFVTGAADDQPLAEASQHPEWFQQQKKPSTHDRDWNKTLPATHGSIQPWISELANQADSRSSFNELMDTPMDISAFLMNRLKVDTLTPKLLVGPTYELMKGSCKSLVGLEFFLEEVYKVTTDQLDWNNPKGQQYPHNLLKPLPLIPNSRGRRVILFDHFINNNLEYLCGGAYSRKYITSVTKTKAADYGHIKWIEDLNVHKKHRNLKACGRPSTSDETLNDVSTALDDRLKGIWMKCLPQTIWRKIDKERAATMI
nr:hypothetical protein [Tanacetum cinerariifolium]